VENTLRNLHGVLDVKAKLTDNHVGEAEVLYNLAELTLEEIKQAVPTASGERHKFVVISAIEDA